MEKYREILLVLSSLGVLESIFFGLYLLTIQGERKLANRLLSILIFALALRIGKSVLLYFSDDLPDHIRNFGLGAKLAIGPALYLYVRAFIEQQRFRFRAVYLLHFVPFFIYALIAAYVSNHTAFAPYRFILLQFFIYLILALGHWRQALQSSSLQPHELRWVRNLTLGIFLVWLSYTLHYVRVLPYYITGALMYSIVVYGLIYVALKRNSLFVVTPAPEKYKNSKIAQDKSQDLLEQILTFFDTEQPFLDPGLTLDKVAQKLHLAPRTVSQVINEQRQQNFSDFINTYRIGQAQVLLRDARYHQHTIASIAYESGFNSLSAFNTAFKKNTQTTPSAFRKLAKSG
ncbi:helix-turn-helix transcriptional regulator [uncultured Microscilla sp.]|uniref:helix-turn-helix domain-containing protein n=1 Tax=uncultured Microscilla sp. TaxID=432653 RepID=UPI00260FB5E6|nr:helix-turn-helix transcriptional regulator [uncultured Microscilla sp.]